MPRRSRPKRRRAPKREFFLDVWADALKNPAKAFKDQSRSRHTLLMSSGHLAISGLVAAIFMIASGHIGSYLPLMYIESLLGQLFWILLAVAIMIGSIIGWLVISGIIYLFARLLGGRGSYAQQSHLIAIYAAPLSIISNFITYFGGLAAMPINITPITVVLSVISTILLMYWAFLLTVALRTEHKYSAEAAVMTWLIPLFVAFVFVGIAISAISLASFAHL